LRQYYKLTFKAIGELFNNRDHATILHGCDRHRDDYQYCFDYKKKYDYIFNQHSLSW
jgi:chromosomal replication initiation ATPase DnaA